MRAAPASASIALRPRSEFPPDSPITEFWRPALKFDALNLGALVLGVLLLAAGGPWLARQIASLPGPSTLAARRDDRIVTLEVGGMTCETCVAAVKGQLSEVPGVSAVEVRLAERRAVVVCEPEVGDSLLTAAVRRAGGGFVATVAHP